MDSGPDWLSSAAGARWPHSLGRRDTHVGVLNGATRRRKEKPSNALEPTQGAIRYMYKEQSDIQCGASVSKPIHCGTRLCV